MKKVKQLAMLCFCTIAAAGATFAQNTNTNTNTQNNENNQNRQNNKMMTTKLTPEEIDRKFMMEAAMGNMAEIQLAQLALKKSKDADVRNFAQMMIDHHTSAQNDLRQAAQTMGMTLPGDVGPNHKAVMDGLDDMSGMNFDMAYIKLQMSDHAAMADMYRMHTKSGKDTGLKDYSRKTLPVVENHWEMTKSIDNKMHKMMMPMNSNTNNNR